MTTLLALETTGALCSVAIHAAGVWFEDTQNVARLHNQVLLAQVRALAARAGVDGRAFDLVAFGAGPGSFTGVRIAAAAAQAVALAADATVVPVSSSRALAETARTRCAAAAVVLPGVLTVTRSRRDAHYLSAWAFAAHGCHAVLADVLHVGSAAPDLGAFAAWTVVGDRPPWWSSLAGTSEFVEGLAVTAEVIGRLALADHASGRSMPPEFALPVYVAGDSPWQPARKGMPRRGESGVD